MTDKEARMLLRKRYTQKGYPVRRVRKSGNQFVVSFGQTEEGKGAGPRGLERITCEWPTKDPGTQQELPFSSKRRRAKRGLL